MVDSAPVKIGMPLEEFMRLFDQEGPFELINGERKRKMPNVFGHSEMILLLLRLLDAFTLMHGLGNVYPETTFILPEFADLVDWVKGSRIPDLMFFAANRIANYKTENPNHRTRPLALVPDLVIEVVSPNDQYSEIDEKVDLYLADGVRLVWVIDPQRRKVSVHTSDNDQPHVLKGDALLKGEDVLPGFEISLTRLFES